MPYDDVPFRNIYIMHNLQLYSRRPTILGAIPGQSARSQCSASWIPAASGSFDCQRGTDEQETHFALEAVCLTKVRSSTMCYGDMIMTLRSNTATKVFTQRRIPTSFANITAGFELQSILISLLSINSVLKYGTLPIYSRFLMLIPC